MEKLLIKLPELSGDLLFSQTTLNFLLVLLLLVAGILLCFVGYQHLQALILFAAGCFCGMLGIKIAVEMTRNLMIQMSFFVMFTFIGVCLLYLLSIIVATILWQIKLRNLLLKKMYFFTALIGGLIIGVVVYFCVYQDILIASLIALLMMISGSLYGKRKMARQRVFYTYADLCEMKPFDQLKS